MPRRFASILLILLAPLFLHAEADVPSINIDASVTLTTFKPFQLFGNNTSGWANPMPVQKKIQAAGNFILRYPGGSWGDIFHWNGKGSFSSEGVWVPSDSEYAPSRISPETGPTYGSHNAFDGDPKTAWRSNPNTDFPRSQWVALDFGSKKDVDSMKLTWGDTSNPKFPYAKKFTVQYWNPQAGRQWMVYGAPENGWLDTSAKNVTGKGGAQSLSFKSVNTQYVRILLTQSSAGVAGSYSMAEMKAFQGANEVSDAKSKVWASTTHPASTLSDRGIFGFEDFMKFIQAFEHKAEPLIIVNFGTGTPQEAAAWVHYANKVKGYGIKYWEFGNETGGDWEAGGPVNGVEYARRYIQYYEAMKAEDPSIHLIPMLGADDPSELYDGRTNLSAFLDRLAKDKKTSYVTDLSLHQYPNWGMSVPALLDSPQTEPAARGATIDAQLSKYLDPKAVNVWLTEFNTSDQVKPHDISVHLENSLWLAQYIPEFAKQFGPRAYTAMWDVLNGGSATHEPFGGDHGYLQAEEGPYQYQERADYWAMQLLTTAWAIPGDTRDHAMVRVENGQSLLTAYADYRPDGKLSLLVVNKDPQSPTKTEVRIKGFKPEGKAETWTFNSSNYRWNTDKLPYHADPDKAPTEGKISVKKSFAYKFPPYSITVIRFSPSVPKPGKN